MYNILTVMHSLCLSYISSRSFSYFRTTIMRWKFEIQSTCSFCLALAIFTVNIHCPAVAKSSDKKGDRRRQRLFFNMQASSATEETGTSEEPSTHESDFNVSDNTLELLPRRKPIDIKGEKSDGPPLIGGSSKNQLTLTLMGKFKNTWCKTETFKQLIKEPGCLPTEVLNRFCYGQCNSFYIPRTLRKRTKRKVFKSCGVCKPKRTHISIVVLKCPGRKKGYKHKKVRTVKECQCMER